MITLSHLTHTFPTSEWPLTIFDDAHLTVESGEWVAIMAPSGSGKSTLLNLLSGLLVPTSGSIHIDGVDITALSEDERARRRGASTAFIFQSFHLIPSLTVEENIDFPSDLNRLKRAHTTAEILEKVGMSSKAKRYPFELSGGEQQRVAIARAFASDVPILLADEPTGNLDRNNAEKVMGIMESFHRESGKTLIMITHDPQIAARAQRRVTIEGGGIVESA